MNILLQISIITLGISVWCLLMMLVWGVIIALVRQMRDYYEKKENQ